MTEGEKVILALEKCTTHNGDCEGCPYADDLRSGHQKRLMGEALDLIKSLQTAKVVQQHKDIQEMQEV